MDRRRAHVHEEHNGSESDLAIYPLLVLPSAFPTEGKPKDRRFHELNAGLVLRVALREREMLTAQDRQLGPALRRLEDAQSLGHW